MNLLRATAAALPAVLPRYCWPGGPGPILQPVW
jgi:hypothetical protein